MRKYRERVSSSASEAALGKARGWGLSGVAKEGPLVWKRVVAGLVQWPLHWGSALSRGRK